jgi:hypothetical protein
MRYLQFITICLFIISCSSVPGTDDMTTSKKKILEENKLIDTLTQLPDVIEDIVIDGKTIKHKGYKLIISESTKAEFEDIKVDETTKLLTEKECVQNKRISITSEKEIDLKLANGNYFTLKKSKTEDDEQFFGYTFTHFDSIRNIYVLWENWLEAGHPIMVNAVSGKTTIIYGSLFRSNTNQTLTANFEADIGAGWTPNGIQVFEIKNNAYVQLFEFDPTRELDERWGPVNIKWKNDNTIYMECITHDDKGGYLTFYKVIQYKKLG